MKLRVIILAILLIISTTIAYSTEGSSQTPVAPPITSPQKVSFENCSKMFTINKEKLYYLTLGAISANNFIIEEIQTENGYIIFYAAKNKYLATIASIDSQNSILKITPCNEFYVFPPGVIINIFKYIELNINTEIK